ncbi:hypothetical protein MNBD_CHLOROFLEXI01-2453 [hydrothermal vent metagenome]|uniref:Peptidase C14 caspase domain-containing protein n=1 Tax=hydrothermal vent metagenome TaxID=652676 RepID=A0A3B0V1N2_9ZZZZ
MAEIFEHGYAVIVGVDKNNISRLALPSVAKDVQAVHDVLIHPERCAYKPDNVKLLMGEDASNKNILDALYWLQDKVKADAEATAVIYYSGHGMVDNATDQYYLIPYDIRSLSRVRADAIKADELTAEISSIKAKRLLAILDCCHASGMGVKNVDLSAIDDGADVKSASFPIDLPETKDIPAYEAAPGAKAVSDLLDGNGRAILNSSTGAQSSYVRQDGKMSLFTYHLIEALTGHAPHPEDASVVYVTDVMSWVTHEVKKSARKEGVEQTPVMRTSGVFPIAQLIGGQGVAKGLGGTLPDPLAELPTVGTTFNQQNQTVHGAQVNVGGDAHIGQIGDNINTGGGDYVGGNKTVNEGDVVHGDKVAGDKVGGDKISVGDISGGTGIAIGSGASANVTVQHGVSGDELNQLFAPLLAEVAQHDVTAVAKVQALKAEAGRGEEADDEKMADLIGEIADAVPAVVEGLVNLFTNSILAKAAGGATKYILKRIRK